nr:MAG TPA_asm: hypothetical protein [Caudoviricetes sp.]
MYAYCEIRIQFPRVKTTSSRLTTLLHTHSD